MWKSWGILLQLQSCLEASRKSEQGWACVLFPAEKSSVLNSAHR